MVFFVLRFLHGSACTSKGDITANRHQRDAVCIARVYITVNADRVPNQQSLPCTIQYRTVVDGRCKSKAWTNHQPRSAGGKSRSGTIPYLAKRVGPAAFSVLLSSDDKKRVIKLINEATAFLNPVQSLTSNYLEKYTLLGRASNTHLE
jgi:hypothetical protein